MLKVGKCETGEESIDHNCSEETRCYNQYKNVKQLLYSVLTKKKVNREMEDIKNLHCLT